MITSALLLAVGLALGWRYGPAMLVLASGLVALAFVAVCLLQADFSLLKLMILFAHLTALQGGFLLGQYLSCRADVRRRGTGSPS